jgi:hypothetical protein
MLTKDEAQRIAPQTAKPPGVNRDGFAFVPIRAVMRRHRLVVGLASARPTNNTR